MSYHGRLFVTYTLSIKAEVLVMYYFRHSLC